MPPVWLLKQIMPNTGGRPSETSAVTHPSLSRKEAGDEAGLSPHQQKQAVNVANVAESEFTAMVESDNAVTKENRVDESCGNILEPQDGSPKPRSEIDFISTLLTGELCTFFSTASPLSPAIGASGTISGSGV